MDKYISKPQTVEAMQYRKGVVVPHAIEAPDGSVYVHTAQGKIRLQDGDFVVGWTAGTQRVVSGDKFAAAFTPAPKAAKKKATAKKKAPAKKAATKKKVAKKKAAKK